MTAEVRGEEGLSFTPQHLNKITDGKDMHNGRRVYGDHIEDSYNIFGGNKTCDDNWFAEE